MPINRRELLTKTAAAAVGAVAAPKLLASAPCVPRGAPIRQGIVYCGDSCENYGMVGRYPHCYYQQYTYLNATLANNMLSAHNSTHSAIGSLTVTQGQWNSMVSYAQQLGSHLSVAVTQINECLRLQKIGGILYQPVTQDYLNQASGWAGRYGFDPNVTQGIVEAAMPIGNTTTVPSLQQQILNLPDYQAMDNIWDFVQAQTTSVTINNGICGISQGDAEKWVQAGGDMTIAGFAAGLLAPLTGPAAPAVALVGDAIAAFGGVMWIAGHVCLLGY